MKSLTATLLFTSLFLLMGCERNPSTTASSVAMDDWEIRTYEVDHDAGSSSVKALNRLLAAQPITAYLHKGDSSFSEVAHVVPGQGRAWLAGGGLVALNAPPSIHEGVPDLLKKISTAKAKTQSLVTTEFWSLAAVAGKNPGNLSPELEKAVAAFRQARPGLCIVEIDHLSIPSTEGHEFKASGQSLEISGYTMRAEDKMMTSVDMTGLNSLRTMVKGNPGETLVVFESLTKPKHAKRADLSSCGVNADDVKTMHSILAIKMTPEG